MKKTLVISLSLISSSVFAFERAVNYDPAHNPAFTNAQQQLNISKMQQQMKQDVEAIQKTGFAGVKTFYSSYATIDGKKTFNAADVVCPMNMNLYLGVYEFNPDSDHCANWCEEATKIQVQNAIASANKYPDCVKMIIIGNEDIYNWNFTEPNRRMQERISNDISQVQNSIMNKNILVSSAQQDGAWLKLAANDPYGILPKINTLGVNIYPYWSQQKPDVSAAKTEFFNRYKAMQAAYPAKTMVITEEGWPSSHSSGQNPNASLEQAKAYYNWWLSRESSDTFSSIYFSMYDKQPLNSDADKYFGLCGYNNQSKIIDQCQ